MREAVDLSEWNNSCGPHGCQLEVRHSLVDEYSVRVKHDVAVDEQVHPGQVEVQVVLKNNLGVLCRREWKHLIEIVFKWFGQVHLLPELIAVKFRHIGGFRALLAILITLIEMIKFVFLDKARLQLGRLLLDFFTLVGGCRGAIAGLALFPLFNYLLQLDLINAVVRRTLCSLEYRL